MFFSYARVSTIEQDRPGTVSIEEQLRKCRAIAQMRSVPKMEQCEYADRGVSGSISLKARGGGGEMIASLRKGDVVCAAKVDRIFRSGSDALNHIEHFKDMGVSLILADVGVEPITEGASKFFFGMLSMMAEFERFRIRERTEEGRRGKRERCGYLGGGVPYGFRVVGVGRDALVQPDPEEQEILAKVKELTGFGHKPGRVARYLTQYHPTRSGKAWQQIQVERILQRG